MSRKVQMGLPQSNLFRYKKASKPLRARILDEFCQVCGYNRKYAIRLLNGPAPQKPEVTNPKGTSPHLWCESHLVSDGHLGGRGLSVLGASKLSYRCGSPGRSSAWLFRPKPQNQLLSISPAPSTGDSRPKSAN